VNTLMTSEGQEGEGGQEGVNLCAAAGYVFSVLLSCPFPILQEHKEALEKLQMETIRLSKQLQLERSLKDR
jgi:hypothetical protein